MIKSKKKNVIVIGGPGGSGSSTIARMISNHFDKPHIYAGDLFRKEAKRKDIENFEEFLHEVSEGGNTLDIEIDNLLDEYAKKGNIVIDSKIYGALCKKRNIKNTISIWLYAKLSVRVKRHLDRDSIRGFKRVFGYMKAYIGLYRRYRIDREKYWRLYEIKYDKPELYYDIVIDSSKIDEKETFNLILQRLDDGKHNKEK